MADKGAACQLLADLLAPSGVISLAERVPQRTQRFYTLIDSAELDADLVARWRQAEEAIYADPSDPLVNWDESDLQAALTATGLAVTVQGETVLAPTPITPAMISRWFTPMTTGKPAYIDRLAMRLAKPEIERIRQLFERQLTGQPVLWQAYTVFVVAQFV